MLTSLHTTDVRYQRQLRRFPLLEADEEAQLAKRWREQFDREAVHKLLTSHLRLVVAVARSYRGYGLPISELISEGNMGLMEAATRFDPEKGARFSSYAVWWIKAAMQEYVLRTRSLVKIGTRRSERILFFNLRKLKSRIGAMQEGDMRPDQVRFIAEHLEVGEKDVVEMNRRLGGDISLNMPVREEGLPIEWQDLLADERPSQEKLLAESDEFEQRYQALREALATLSDRERYVFEMRRLADEPLSLEVLASRFGVSRERVRQIEARAFGKISRSVRGFYSQKTGASREAAVRSKSRRFSQSQKTKTATPCRQGAGEGSAAASYTA
jgi:RNA polymerase sigma-32 factor